MVAAARQLRGRWGQQWWGRGERKLGKQQQFVEFEQQLRQRVEQQFEQQQRERLMLARESRRSAPREPKRWSLGRSVGVVLGVATVMWFFGAVPPHKVDQQVRMEVPR